MKKSVWLASYPKSGNTWFRLLMANLGTDTPADINALPEEGRLASGRRQFDNLMLFPSGLLTHDECDGLRPMVYEALAPGAGEAAGQGSAADVRFVKTHDAWTHVAGGAPLLGGRKAADGAILLVRDPRDVALSLASHLGRGVDEAIRFMSDPDAAFCGREDRQQHQLRQQLPGWSGFNRTWLAQDEVLLHVIRYEDLHGDTVASVLDAIRFVGVRATRGDVERAVDHASFANMQAQERARGFREAPPGQKNGFFRRGRPDGWRMELTPEQVARIEAAHAGLMDRFGYSRAGGEATAAAASGNGRG